MAPWRPRLKLNTLSDPATRMSCTPVVRLSFRRATASSSASVNLLNVLIESGCSDQFGATEVHVSDNGFAMGFDCGD